MNPDLEKAIAAIRAQGGTDADVESYVQSLGGQDVTERERAKRQAKADMTARRMASENALDRASTFGPLNEAGAKAQAFADASTFGLAGLLTDALSPGSFAANRQARRAGAELMTPRDRTLAAVAGGLSNPVGALFAPAEGASLLARTGLASANAATQAGAQAAIEGLDDFSPAGLLQAGKRGLNAAVVGAVAGPALQAAARGTRAVGTLFDIASSRPLDKVMFEMTDAMKKADDALYGAVRREAGAVGSTPAIRNVLQSQTVRPFADIVRASEEFAGADDATVLTEAYKRMSEAQRKAANSMEGTPDFLAGIAQRNRDIGIAKGRMMDVADSPTLDPSGAGNPPPIPTFREAVRTHATAMGEQEALTTTSRIIRKALNGVQIGEKKLTIDSPEALRRAIPLMTPREAEAARAAILGRAKETMRLTANPVGKFGIVSSTAHAIKAPFQIEEFLQLLDAQAGKGPIVSPDQLFGRSAGPFRRAGASSVAGRMVGGLLAP